MGRGLRRVGRFAAVLLPLALAACQTLIKPGWGHQGEPPGLDSSPACQKDPTLEAVACDIDHIEKHIDLWGSITTKHPDVWGASRMTKYQQEVESIFSKEVDAKNVNDRVLTFQGARARSDQAFLAQAIAINAALTGQQAALLPPDPITVVTGTQTTTASNALQANRAAKTSTSSSTDASGKTTSTADGSTSNDQSSTAKSGTDASRTTTTQAPPAVGIPTGASIPADFTTYTNSSVNVNRNPATLAAMPGFGTGGLQLEPTIILDEKKRFLDHLNEIRRVNEGDDTADSPGYALYLVRVPVSLLPGKMTKIGHGAEIMISINPIVGEDLLPSTFRSLVINDMVDQFSELVTSALNADRPTLLKAMTENEEAQKNPKGDYPPTTANQKKLLDTALARVRPKYTAPQPSRQAEYAFPMNHLQELFGDTYVKALIVAAANHFRTDLEQNKVVHLHEVRGVVREQIVAGYRFLTTGNPHAWALCTQDLARAVRDLNGDAGGVPSVLHTYKKQYDDLLGREIDKKWDIDSDRLVIKALGWAILLESALLTDQLVRDIKETATHKGCACPAEEWLDYFHPTPSPTARQAFNNYVGCRWPTYTFAVDPVTEQQNVQDTLSQRREMQLALSLAFASGAVSAQSFTRFARRLEADYQTIDLNRTVVGFSHGDNTFGWRFYPRFQPPEIPSNLTVVTRDLIGGLAFTKRQEIRQRRLEPGQRECVAMVIMPSFVPFAEVSVSSSWFNLNDPKCKSHSTKETVKLSQRLHAIETVCPKGDQDRYRAGELGRLQAKAQMLATRLPLQDMKFPVPYENTLGGFEFFNSGVTDLAPQLRGWYGVPGYDGNAVDVFLMGDHFSVVNTSVIAGGKRLSPDAVQLLSRQVVRVSLPAGMALSEDKAGLYSENGKFVDIRLATPYGITGPVRLPAIGAAPAAAAQAPVLVATTDNQMIALDQNTDLVLTGSNFTADTRIFAGGKMCAVEVMSKSVVKVTIPKGVTPISTGGFVELKAATASGVSKTILVPIVKVPPTEQKPAAFSDSTLSIAFTYKNIGIVAVDEPNFRPPQLTINITDPTVKLTDNDAVDVVFAGSDGTQITVTGITYSAVDKQLTNFATTLRDQIFATYSAKFGPENVNPPVPIKLTATFKDKNNNPRTVKVADALTIQWIRANPAEK